MRITDEPQARATHGFDDVGLIMDRIAETIRADVISRVYPIEDLVRQFDVPPEALERMGAVGGRPSCG